MKLRTSISAAALLVAACGAAAVHAQDLSLAYHEGDAYKYGLHVATKATFGSGGLSVPVEFDISAAEAVSVLSVDSSGNADVSITTSNATIKTISAGMTNTTTGTPSMSVQLRIAPDGRLLTVNGQPLSGTPLGQLGSAAGSFVTAVLPSTAVKPGDTWSKTYDMANPMGAGAVHVVANSKYLRNESLKGVDAAVVETKSTSTFNLTLDLSKLTATMNPGGLGPAGAGGASRTAASPPGSMTLSGTSTSDTTTWIDPGSHRVMKTHSVSTVDATLTTTPAAPKPAPVTPADAASMGPIALTGSGTLDLTPA